MELLNKITNYLKILRNTQVSPSLRIPQGVQVLAILFSFLELSIFSQTAYATSYINVSSGSGGTVSLGSIKPSSTGVSASGSDTLTITTNCSAGYSVYVSGQEGKGTSLTNSSASTNNTISASETTVGSTATTLNSNTWGITGDSTNALASKYVGLPSYANATNKALITTSSADTSGDNKNTVYYGVKVDTSLTPGTYSGDVLYTTLVTSACNNYTVKFNTNGGTGTMSDQTIPVGTATSLTMNKFTRDGYMFLGWGTSSSATEPTYKDGEKVTNISDFNTIITLYALWGQSTGNMQDFKCTDLASGTTTYLTDIRDNQVYSVYRIPTDQTYAGTSTVANIAGKCLMTKDLSLGYVTGGSITKGSNLALSTDTSAGSTTSSKSIIYVDTANGGAGWNTDNTDINLQYTNGPRPEYEVYSNHSYYSFDASQKVCPKGWKLPTSEEYGTNNSSSAATIGLAAIVGNDANGSTALQSYPWSFVLGGGFGSGDWNYQTTLGSYWSSAQNAAKGYGYFLAFNLSFVYQTYTVKNSGRSVRCIAENNYTISYSAAGADSGEPSKTSEVAYESGKVTMPTVGSMVKDGYDFKGWALTSGATSTTYTAEQIVTISDLLTAASSAGQTTTAGSTITLYPVWEITIPDDGNLGTMQNFICNNLTSGHTATLTDSRDNQTYTVYRFPDTGTAGIDYPTGMPGYCIMTKDLSLGYVTSGSVTRGSNLTLTTSDSAAAATIIARTSPSNWLTTNDDSNKQYINGAGGTYDAHSYYSFGAALAVCPKGWMPPTNTEYDNIAAFMGGDNGDGSGKIRGVPYGFVYGGYVGSGGWGSLGNTGGYWASSQSSSTMGHRLVIGASRLYTDGNLKDNGRSVRCIIGPETRTVSDITYMQDISSTIINNTADGATATLKDARDNQSYTVYKIPSNSVATNVAGKLIMTKDLNLGAVASVSGASSKIVANGTMTLSPNDSNFDQNANSTVSSSDIENVTYGATETVKHSTSTSDYAETTANETYANKKYNASGTGTYAGRGYYTWGAALVVCPKNWRLPTRDEYGSADNTQTTGIGLAVGGNTADGLAAAKVSPWYLENTGDFSNVGWASSSMSNRWTSTQNSTTGAARFTLGYNSTWRVRILNRQKILAYAVRCIAD